MAVLKKKKYIQKQTHHLKHLIKKSILENNLNRFKNLLSKISEQKKQDTYFLQEVAVLCLEKTAYKHLNYILLQHPFLGNHTSVLHKGLMTDVFENKDLKGLQILLQRGFLKQQKNHNLLHMAVKYNYMDFVQLLLSKGVDINEVDSKGNIPLFYLKDGEDDTEVYDYLIQNGADTSVRNNGGWGLLHIASTLKNNKAVLKKILLLGLNIDATTNKGQTALLLSLNNHNPFFAKLLIDQGCDTSVKDEEGEDALMIAGKNNYAEIVKLLIPHHSNIDEKNEKGQTSLTVGVIKEHYENIKMLIASGSDLNTQDTLGWTPLHHAVENNNLEIVKILVKNGADFNIPDTTNWTPLILASWHGCVDIVNYLIDEGADVNTQDTKGYSPLMINIFENKTSIVKKILEKNPDISFVNKNGENALMIADKIKNPFVLTALQKYRG
jgi:ankyrin repeat protein